MFRKKDHQKSFYSVAMALIITGIIILGLGLAGWVMNYFSFDFCYLTIPSLKVMGGLVILSLGYIILELDLLRQK